MPAALLPLPLVIAVSSSWMGQLAARIGPRLPLTIGPLIVAVGCALALRIGEPGSYFATALPGLSQQYANGVPDPRALRPAGIPGVARGASSPHASHAPPAIASSNGRTRSCMARVKPNSAAAPGVS